MKEPQKTEKPVPKIRRTEAPWHDLGNPWWTGRY